MSNGSLDHLAFYVEVLLKLDELDVPYVIIGGFAASMFGITRVTLDIDILVALEENHIQALAASFPSPPYYADPYQMRDAGEGVVGQYHRRFTRRKGGSLSNYNG